MTKKKATQAKQTGAKRDEYGLTMKQRQFADLYRGGPNEVRGNAAACYQEVYPRASKASAETKGPAMVRNVQVSEYLALRAAEASEQSDITQERVLREVGRIALCDVRRVFDERGGLRHPHDWDDETAAAVSSVEVVTKVLPTPRDEPPEIEYVHKIRFWDKNSAAEKLMKHLGMFEADNRQKSPLDDLPRDVLALILSRLRGDGPGLDR